MNFLKLIRYPNLLLIILAQIAVRYGILIPSGADFRLTTFQFGLLVFASVCIAAGGNIINDLYDIEIDKVNKPGKVLIGKRFREKQITTLFIILNCIGVGIGFYISNAIGKSGFAAIFIIISASLFLYASNLKRIFLIGNLLVSILVGLSLIIIPIFDLLPEITSENKILQGIVFKMVLNFAGFAFFVNFIREIVKDLLDINGDKKGDVQSLPIVLGRKRTVKIVFILGVILLFSVLRFMYQNLYNQKIPMLYFLIFLVAPILFFIIKSWDADKNKKYRLLSTLLKWIMFFGICAMFLFRFSPFAFN